MRNYIITLLILLQLTASGGLSYSQAVTMRIPDTTAVAGDSVNIPVYADVTLTGKNIYSYTLQVTFNQAIIQPVSVITAGTLSNPLGAPSANLSVPGKVTIAGAGTTALTGAGVFIYIRFRAVAGWSTGINFTGIANNFFNEGTPAMTLDNGSITVTDPPSITVSPDNAVSAKGEQIQFSVGGGTPPYSWSVTNPAVAGINSSGLLTCTQTGQTRVVAVDNTGIKDTSGIIDIRDFMVYISDTLTQWQGYYIDVPVYTTSVTGLNIYSGNINLSFNQNLLTPVSVNKTGTMLSSYTVTENHGVSGTISLAFAGTSPLTGAGTLVYVRFLVSSINNGSTDITFTNAVFDQTYYPCTDNGYFTTISLPALTINPDNGTLIAGQTLQFTLTGGGIPPFTWSVDDTAVATIDSTGLMTTRKGGTVIVSVTDSVGAADSSGTWQVYDTEITLPDTLTCPPTQYFYYPVLVKSLPAGQSVYSVTADISYNASLLSFVDLELNGTLTQGWTYAKNPTSGRVVFAGMGTNMFSASGAIVYLKFLIDTSFGYGSNAAITMNSILLNEGVPNPEVDNSGYIYGSDPVLTLSPNQAICEGASVTLTASGANTYTWSPATGLNSLTGSTVVASPLTTTDYTVTGTSGLCSSTASVNVTVYPSPHINSLTNTGFCRGDSVLITVSGASDYAWSPATGLSATTGDNVYARPSVSTVYKIVCSPNGWGCYDSTTISVAVKDIPVIKTGPNNPMPTICAGNSVDIYATGATSYSWSPATGLNNTYGTLVMASPTTTTVYTVTGTSVVGCSNTANITVTVNPKPTITITPATSLNICSGGAVQLTAGGGTSYSWSPATGLSAATGAVVIANPTTTTAYTVTGINASGCTNTASVTVTVSPSISVTVSPSAQTACSGAALPLVAGGAQTYSWSPATGLSATTGANITASPTTTTTYTVTGTSGGCTGSASVTVTVAAAITVTVTPSQAICSGNKLQLTAAGAVSYTWSPSSGLSATTGATVTTSTSSTRTYTVTGTTGGCTSSASVTVTVNAKPNVTASANTSICEGGSTPLTASGGISYTWAPATGLSATTGANVNAGPAATTDYVITGANALGCTDTAKVKVTVHLKPQVMVVSEPGAHDSITLCLGDTVKLFALGAGAYSWSPATGLNETTGTMVLANPATASAYSVSGTDGYGCVNTSSIKITVINCNKIYSSDKSNYIRIFPNPSGGVFNVELAGYKGKEADIIIYDVKGQAVMKEKWRIAANLITKELRLDAHAKGVYIMKMINDSETSVTKIIIE